MQLSSGFTVTSLIAISCFSSSVIYQVEGRLQELFPDSLSGSFEDLSSTDDDLSLSSEEDLYFFTNDASLESTRAKSKSETLFKEIAFLNTFETTTETKIKRTYWQQQETENNNLKKKNNNEVHTKNFNVPLNSATSMKQPTLIDGQSKWQRREKFVHIENFNELTNNAISTEKPILERKYKFQRQQENNDLDKNIDSEFDSKNFDDLTKKETENDNAENKRNNEVENEILNELAKNSVSMEQPIHIKRKNNWQQTKNNNLKKENKNEVDSEFLSDLLKKIASMEPIPIERNNKWQQRNTENNYLKKEKNNEADSDNIEEPTKHEATTKQSIQVETKNNNDHEDSKINTWEKADYRIE